MMIKYTLYLIYTRTDSFNESVTDSFESF